MDYTTNYLSQLSTSVMDNKSKADINILANGESSNLENIKKTAEDFEAVFITQMLQHMFDGVETNELFGGGHAEDTMKVMLFDEYGKTISAAGGLGIAEHVQRELLALQEV